MFNWLLCTILELGEVSAPVGVLEAADSKKTHRPSLTDCQVPVPGILLAISAQVRVNTFEIYCRLVIDIPVSKISMFGSF